jgi:hypothetical protein
MRQQHIVKNTKYTLLEYRVYSYCPEVDERKITSDKNDVKMTTNKSHKNKNRNIK